MSENVKTKKKPKTKKPKKNKSVRQKQKQKQSQKITNIINVGEKPKQSRRRTQQPKADELNYNKSLAKSWSVAPSSVDGRELSNLRSELSGINKRLFDIKVGIPKERAKTDNMVGYSMSDTYGNFSEPQRNFQDVQQMEQLKQEQKNNLVDDETLNPDEYQMPEEFEFPEPEQKPNINVVDENNKVVYRTKRAGGRKQGEESATERATLDRIRRFHKSFNEGRKLTEQRTQKYNSDINDYGYNKLPPNVKTKHNEIVNKLQL